MAADTAAYQTKHSSRHITVDSAVAVYSASMADRDSKLSKAREKLDKFRKKKKTQEEEDPEKQTSSPNSPSSSTSSPIMFQARTSLEAEITDNYNDTETTKSGGNQFHF